MADTGFTRSPSRPRFCYLKRLQGYDGYGFYLDTVTGVGKHYVRKVEEDSPAELTGIKVDDRIVEVNGVSVYDLDYMKVLELILKHEEHVFLIVLDAAAEEEFADEIVTSAYPNLDYRETPAPSRGSEESACEKGDCMEMISENNKCQKENLENASKEQRQNEEDKALIRMLLELTLIGVGGIVGGTIVAGRSVAVLLSKRSGKTAWREVEELASLIASMKRNG